MDRNKRTAVVVVVAVLLASCGQSRHLSRGVGAAGQRGPRRQDRRRRRGAAAAAARDPR